MSPDFIKKVLEEVSAGKKDVNEAMKELKELPYADLGYAHVDHHRHLRRGYPEVIFCAGKTPKQISGIIENMLPHKNNILGTRASIEAFEEVKKICDRAEYSELGRAALL